LTISIGNQTITLCIDARLSDDTPPCARRKKLQSKSKLYLNNYVVVTRCRPYYIVYHWRSQKFIWEGPNIENVFNFSLVTYFGDVIMMTSLK